MEKDGWPELRVVPSLLEIAKNIGQFIFRMPSVNGYHSDHNTGAAPLLDEYMESSEGLSSYAEVADQLLIPFEEA